jgi:hypothetical protein
MENKDKDKGKKARLRREHEREHQMLAPSQLTHPLHAVPYQTRQDTETWYGMVTSKTNTTGREQSNGGPFFVFSFHSMVKKTGRLDWSN